MPTNRGDETETARWNAQRAKSTNALDGFFAGPKDEVPPLTVVAPAASTVAPRATETHPWATTWAKLGPLGRKAQRERWKVLLLPHVHAVAQRNGAEGFIAADVQSEGIAVGILNGEEWFVCNPLPIYRNAYAWIGQWLSYLAESGVIGRKLLSLENSGKLRDRRTSTRKRSKGNGGHVFVALQFAAPARSDAA